MKRALSLGTFVAAGAFVVLLVPFLWVASETPASGMPVLISLEGVDLQLSRPNGHIADGKLSREQAANAYYIVCASVWVARSRRAAVIAVATALQESSLRNLRHGDRPIDSGQLGSSSRGLFQQMIEFYGESVAMHPVLATQAFLERLVLIPGWETMPVTQAAQAVQRSAHPDAYADEEEAAEKIVSLLWDPIAALGPRACQAMSGGAPIAPEWFEAHPEWLTNPHHDYPATDLPVPAGTVITSVASGIVTAAPVGDACGTGVSIRGDDGADYTYCHGESLTVGRGMRVAAGQPIMVSGWTGRVSPPGPAGAHLHLQIRNAAGQFVCPQPALQSWSQGIPINPAVLPTSGCVS
jgi:murein DD-endopeptidase MepM/ murein hydrolase activator NlpD